MTRNTWRWAASVSALAPIVLWAAMPAVGLGQSPGGQSSGPHVYGTQNGEWRTYGGDLASTRYSPLDQINADNFNKLEVAWRFKTDDLGPRPEFNFQSTPLMVKAAAVLDRRHPPRRRGARRGHRRDAVDAQPERRQARRGGAAPALRPRPGVLDRRQGGADPLRHAGLPADRARREDRRPDSRLRHERHRRSEAGQRSGDGSRHRRDRAARGAGHRQATSSSSAPRTCRAERPRVKTNEKGYVRGFDVRTGKRLWIFHTIPRPGEFGNDTWENDSWSYTGQRRRLGADERRRGAGPGLPAGRAADRRLLRRPSARATDFRREPCRRRC